MINFKTFDILYNEAKESTNVDMYIMGRGWQDWWMDDIGDADTIADILRDIYDIAHDGVKAIVEVYGYSKTSFSATFHTPANTLSNWCNGMRTPPEYAVLWLGYLVILDKYQ